METRPQDNFAESFTNDLPFILNKETWRASFGGFKARSARKKINKLKKVLYQRFIKQNFEDSFWDVDEEGNHFLEGTLFQNQKALGIPDHLASKIADYSPRNKKILIKHHLTKLIKKPIPGHSIDETVHIIMHASQHIRSFVLDALKLWAKTYDYEIEPNQIRLHFFQDEEGNFFAEVRGKDFSMHHKTDLHRKQNFNADYRVFYKVVKKKDHFVYEIDSLKTNSSHLESIFKALDDNVTRFSRLEEVYQSANRELTETISEETNGPVSSASNKKPTLPSMRFKIKNEELQEPFKNKLTKFYEPIVNAELASVTTFPFTYVGLIQGEVIKDPISQKVLGFIPGPIRYTVNITKIDDEETKELVHVEVNGKLVKQFLKNEINKESFCTEKYRLQGSFLEFKRVCDEKIIEGNELGALGILIIDALNKRAVLKKFKPAIISDLIAHLIRFMQHPYLSPSILNDFLAKHAFPEEITQLLKQFKETKIVSRENKLAEKDPLSFDEFEHITLLDEFKKLNFQSQVETSPSLSKVIKNKFLFKSSEDNEESFYRNFVEQKNGFLCKGQPQLGLSKKVLDQIKDGNDERISEQLGVLFKLPVYTPDHKKITANTIMAAANQGVLLFVKGSFADFLKKHNLHIHSIIDKEDNLFQAEDGQIYLSIKGKGFILSADQNRIVGKIHGDFKALYKLVVIEEENKLVPAFEVMGLGNNNNYVNAITTGNGEKINFADFKDTIDTDPQVIFSCYLDQLAIIGQNSSFPDFLSLAKNIHAYFSNKKTEANANHNELLYLLLQAFRNPSLHDKAFLAYVQDKQFDHLLTPLITSTKIALLHQRFELLKTNFLSRMNELQHYLYVTDDYVAFELKNLLHEVDLLFSKANTAEKIAINDALFALIELFKQPYGKTRFDICNDKAKALISQTRGHYVVDRFYRLANAITFNFPVMQHYSPLTWWRTSAFSASAANRKHPSPNEQDKRAYPNTDNIVKAKLKKNNNQIGDATRTYQFLNNQFSNQSVVDFTPRENEIASLKEKVKEQQGAKKSLAEINEIHYQIAAKQNEQAYQGAELDAEQSQTLSAVKAELHALPSSLSSILNASLYTFINQNYLGLSDPTENEISFDAPNPHHLQIKARKGDGQIYIEYIGDGFVISKQDKPVGFMAGKYRALVRVDLKDNQKPIFSLVDLKIENDDMLRMWKGERLEVDEIKEKYCTKKLALFAKLRVLKEASLTTNDKMLIQKTADIIDEVKSSYQEKEDNQEFIYAIDYLTMQLNSLNNDGYFAERELKDVTEKTETLDALLYEFDKKFNENVLAKLIGVCDNLNLKLIQEEINLLHHIHPPYNFNMIQCVINLTKNPFDFSSYNWLKKIIKQYELSSPKIPQLSNFLNTDNFKYAEEKIKLTKENPSRFEKYLLQDANFSQVVKNKEEGKNIFTGLTPYPVDFDFRKANEQINAIKDETQKEEQQDIFLWLALATACRDYFPLIEESKVEESEVEESKVEESKVVKWASDSNPKTLFRQFLLRSILGISEEDEKNKANEKIVNWVNEILPENWQKEAIINECGLMNSGFMLNEFLGENNNSVLTQAIIDFNFSPLPDTKNITNNVTKRFLIAKSFNVKAIEHFNQLKHELPLQSLNIFIEMLFKRPALSVDDQELLIRFLFGVTLLLECNEYEAAQVYYKQLNKLGDQITEKFNLQKDELEEIMDFDKLVLDKVKNIDVTYINGQSLLTMQDHPYPEIQKPTKVLPFDRHQTSAFDNLDPDFDVYLRKYYVPATMWVTFYEARPKNNNADYYLLVVQNFLLNPFDNLLFEELNRLTGNKTEFLENERKTCQHVILQIEFYHSLQLAPDSIQKTIADCKLKKHYEIFTGKPYKEKPKLVDPYAYLEEIRSVEFADFPSQGENETVDTLAYHLVLSKLLDIFFEKNGDVKEFLDVKNDEPTKRNLLEGLFFKFFPKNNSQNWFTNNKPDFMDSSINDFHEKISGELNTPHNPLTKAAQLHLYKIEKNNFTYRLASTIKNKSTEKPEKLIIASKDAYQAIVDLEDSTRFRPAISTSAIKAVNDTLTNPTPKSLEACEKAAQSFGGESKASRFLKILKNVGALIVSAITQNGISLVEETKNLANHIHHFQLFNEKEEKAKQKIKQVITSRKR